MNDLEKMLRTSLHERADDVEPTPELWRSVQHRVARRRSMPLLLWTAAGVAAAVTAVAVVPGLLDGVEQGLVIDPAQSPTAPVSPGEEAPGPVAAAPLTHYVAVVDGRLVLRGVDGSEEVLWESIEGGVRALAVRPGSTPERFTVAAVAGLEGMLDLVVVTRTPAETSVTQTFLGTDSEDATAMPVPAWSPDGTTVATTVTAESGPELVLVDVESGSAEDGMPQQRIALTGIDDPSQLRLQDWLAVGADHRLLLTAGGRLMELDLARTGTGWQLGAVRDAGGEDYVVDVATHPDGRRYRLLAGEGASSGDAEDAGLALFLDDEPVVYPDLPTADPSGVWMTAVDGGAFVGLGSDARQIHVGDGRHEMVPVQGVSYAAWVPVAGDGGAVPHGDPSESMSDTPATEPAVTGGVAPYVAIDPEGRLAVHTGDGGEREVIIDEQLWAPEAGVRVLDASVRPGSSAGEVSGIVLLATEGGPELAWFRAAAGETFVRRLEGPYGLGPTADDPRHAPIFSPDGLHLAWVEPDDAGGWTMRTLGVDEEGPTDEDAGMGLEVDAEQLVLAAWDWAPDSDASGGPARGGIYLAAPGAAETSSYVFPIERQGDGALAVTGPPEPVDRGDTGVIDLGLRDHRPVRLVRTADSYAVQPGGSEEPVVVPIDIATDPRDLDLDVLEGSVVVTHRSTGEAYVVDTTGSVGRLGTVAHGFDPVR